MTTLGFSAGVFFGVTALPLPAAVKIHQPIRLSLVFFGFFPLNLAADTFEGGSFHPRRFAHFCVIPLVCSWGRGAAPAAARGGECGAGISLLNLTHMSDRKDKVKEMKSTQNLKHWWGRNWGRGERGRWVWEEEPSKRQNGERMKRQGRVWIKEKGLRQQWMTQQKKENKKTAWRWRAEELRFMDGRAEGSSWDFKEKQWIFGNFH